MSTAAARKNTKGKEEDGKKSDQLDAAYNLLTTRQGIGDNQASANKRKRITSDITTPSSSSKFEAFDTPEQFGRSMIEMLKPPKHQTFPILSDPGMNVTDLMLLLNCLDNILKHDNAIDALGEIGTEVLIAIFDSCEGKLITFRQELAEYNSIKPMVAATLFVAMDKYAKGFTCTTPLVTSS
jgi:hypothetical protein